MTDQEKLLAEQRAGRTAARWHAISAGHYGDNAVKKVVGQMKYGVVLYRDKVTNRTMVRFTMECHDGSIMKHDDPLIGYPSEHLLAKLRLITPDA